MNVNVVTAAGIDSEYQRQCATKVEQLDLDTASLEVSCISLGVGAALAAGILPSLAGGAAELFCKSFGEVASNMATVKANLIHDVCWLSGGGLQLKICLLYTSPSPRDATLSRMPSSA